MITESLINYIKSQNNKNVSRELIISKLIQVGWRIEDIEEGFTKAVLPTVDEEPIVDTSSIKEVVAKDKILDPYHEPVSFSDDSSLISIRGSKKIEFIKEEPQINIDSNLEKKEKIWIPTTIKPVEEIKKEETESIFKPISTRTIETFQPEIGKPIESINKNPINLVEKSKPIVKEEETEFIPTLKPKTILNKNTDEQIEKISKPQPQPTLTVPKTENTNSIPKNSEVTSFPVQNKILNTKKDLSKNAMISSYSEDYMSANKLKQEVSIRKKRNISKTLIFLFIIFVLIGISFVFVKGYIKIPNFNFSFINKDLKSILLESASQFNSLKFYKVETETKISFPSLTNITTSLISGETITSKEEDYFSILSKGEISKIDDNSKFYDYNLTLKSSILENEIKTNIKNNGEIAFIDIPDLSSIFQGIPVINNNVSIPVKDIENLTIILPDDLNDNKNKIDLFKLVLNNFVKNNNGKLFDSFKPLINNIEIIKKGEENINNIQTHQYSLILNQDIIKDFLNQSSVILINNLAEEDRETFSKMWESVSIKSLDVWIGEDDNNIYQYKFSLAIPLSKIIGLEDKSITNKEVVLDWRKTYSDLDIPNSVIIPIDSINFDTFSIMVKDLKIKNTFSSFALSAEEMKRILGNYGLKSNSTGNCINPTSGSLFSPVGHASKASAEVGSIANNMKLIVNQTNEQALCFSTSKAWAIATPLISDPNKYLCVDNTGNSLNLEKPITKASCK